MKRNSTVKVIHDYHGLEKLKVLLTQFWIYCSRAEQLKQRPQSPKLSPIWPFNEKVCGPQARLENDTQPPW